MTTIQLDPQDSIYIRELSQELDHARSVVRILERSLRAEIMSVAGVDIDEGDWELNTDTGVLVGEAFGEACQQP